jgi:heme exporter protein C
VSSRWRFFRFASPATFYPVAGFLVPWFAGIAAVLAAISLYLGLLVAPTDRTQGDAYRIIFIHVPAAWMSMLLYVVMAFWAAIGWAFNARLASIVARDRADRRDVHLPRLWTGAPGAGRPGNVVGLGRAPDLGLILLFLYGGYLALVSAIDDPRRADRAGALLAIVGSVNVPIIYFSVIWWNTLHQGASVSMTTAPKMASVMLLAMLLMTLAFWAYAFAVIFVRARAIALERDNQAGWASDAVGRRPMETGSST